MNNPEQPEWTDGIEKREMIDNETTSFADPGLVQGSCSHDRQEFIEMAWGADWLRCLDCMEVIERPQDCTGGG